eukprot:1126866-Amphidinium_carterae.1
MVNSGAVGAVPPLHFLTLGSMGSELWADRFTAGLAAGLPAGVVLGRALGVDGTKGDCASARGDSSSSGGTENVDTTDDVSKVSR